VRTDLPLASDDQSRYIPWIVAIMVYLASLALAGALVAGSAVERWNKGLAGALTVQIMPPKTANPKVPDSRVQDAVALLSATPGVIHAEALSDARIAALLAPWLGDQALRDLPLPALIDVRVAPGAAIDLQALQARLAKAVPGAEIDDHQRWLKRLVMLGRAVEVLASVILLLIASAAAAATVFGTRAALAVHHQVIEVLHLIGAHDSYVARQFQIHALKLGFRGGAVGLFAGAVTLAALWYLASAGGAPMSSLAALLPWGWASLAFLPIATGLIAMLTARRTVLRALAEMV
jgi:cell division transport system permease protein